jgi:uncharacterized caspase-like protein
MKRQILVFLLLASLLGSSAQNGVVLESNYQLAWGGMTSNRVIQSPDGKYFAKLCSWRGKKGGKEIPLRIFHVNSCKLYRVFPVDDVFTNDIKFTSDGKKILVLLPYAKRMDVWDIESGKKSDSLYFEHPYGKFDLSSDDRYLILYAQVRANPMLFDLQEKKIVYELTIPRRQDRGDVKFCLNDSAFLVLRFENLYLCDTKSGKILDQYQFSFLTDDFNFTGSFMVFQDGRRFVFNTTKGLHYCSIKNSKIHTEILPVNEDVKCVQFDQNNKILYLINRNQLISYSLDKKYIIQKLDIFKEDLRSDMIFSKTAKFLVDLTFLTINNNTYLVLTDDYTLSYFYSLQTKKIEAYLFTPGASDYAFVTPDGRMDGTTGAIEKLDWVSGMQRVPLAATYDQMYTPNLMAQIFSNSLQENTVKLEDVVKFTPEIRIVSPSAESKTTKPELTLTCEVKANGDEVDKVRIYVNDKLVTDETRGMKPMGTQSTYSVTLLPGENSVKALAITKNGYQSAASEIKVTYTGATAESRLFVMAIGIDKYKNPAYSLNYAVADAKAFTEKLDRSGEGIYKSIRTYSFLNESARRDSVLKGFARIAEEAGPQDAFILYYAGHGVMSEGSPEVPKDFYLALQDVTQLYGRDDLLQSKGISAAEMRDASKKIAAQKQVFFLDACQSGAAVETFAMRGAAEEKAILQLARSTGSYMIASTASDQYATEFKDLGHGVFTYAILQGMSCSAGATESNKITIKQLEAFLNDQIPILTEKYHGTVQYPKSWSKGMDFPIGVCR